MSKNTIEKDKNQSNREVSLDKPLEKGKSKFRIVSTLFDKIIPPFAPLIKIDKKLLSNEKQLDHTIIRYFNEIQIAIGLLLVFIGFLLMIFLDPLMILLLITGIILVFTGFDIEEIYLTSRRLLVRRIGMVERITRIPQDEEHLLSHVVSFSLGRAPTHKLFFSVGIISSILVLSAGYVNYLFWVALLPALLILFFSLRIGKRALTINFSGNHVVLLGVRKGIPLHIINSLTSILYKE